MKETEKNTLQFLEKLRYIAMQGLHYKTGDAYDQFRYEELLTLSSQAYATLLAQPAPDILALMRKELGHITPKVGVSGALFNKHHDIFLVQRKDDQHWCLPCGWCDVNESPEQALTREFKEETGFMVNPQQLLSVSTRLPGDYGALFTSYHLVYLCADLAPEDLTKWVLQPEEVLDAGWFSTQQLSEDFSWHREHQRFYIEAINAHKDKYP